MSGETDASFFSLALGRRKAIWLEELEEGVRKQDAFTVYRYNSLVKSLDASMEAWVSSAASSCFFPPVVFAARRMISWLPTNELLRSGNRPKPQHWTDESTEVEGTSAEEDRDWNDDSDADWTIDSEGRAHQWRMTDGCRRGAVSQRLTPC